MSGWSKAQSLGGRRMSDRSTRKAAIDSAFRRVGLRAEPRYHMLDAHRRALLRDQHITRVLDVGANVGQYARSLRSDGYVGDIVSFEPNPSAAAALVQTAAGDARWHIEPVALGSTAGSLRLHVTVDSLSTSLLAPNAEYGYGFMDEVQEEVEVEVKLLDDINTSVSGSATLLKLDVQGFELEVLRGAERTLQSVAAVECELSLVPLYHGQALIEDVVAHLRHAGLHPVCLVRGFTDPKTHEVVQVDGLFVR